MSVALSTCAVGNRSAVATRPKHSIYDRCTAEGACLLVRAVGYAKVDSSDNSLKGCEQRPKDDTTVDNATGYSKAVAGIDTCEELLVFEVLQSLQSSFTRLRRRAAFSVPCSRLARFLQKSVDPHRPETSLHLVLPNRFCGNKHRLIVHHCSSTRARYDGALGYSRSCSLLNSRREAAFDVRLCTVLVLLCPYPLSLWQTYRLVLSGYLVYVDESMYQHMLKSVLNRYVQ
jgi:hypothetical protein